MLLTVLGILLPFIGTAFGAAAVFILGKINDSVQRAMCAFAAGVMVAASVWSLIIPAVEMCEEMGKLAFLPVLTGIGTGFAIMFLCERLLRASDKSKGQGDRRSMQFFAVTLHNFPEGMAVGMMFSLWLRQGGEGVLASCFAFSIAIALQNIPEGAIISMPHYADGNEKGKAFLLGVFSGAVEPVGAALTLIATGLAERILPYFFGFAAGAMLYVVADELLTKDERHPSLVPICFGVGFCIMMTMDVALG